MLCIISDTHDNESTIAAASVLIEKLSPTLIIHCGDVTTPETMRLLRKLPIRFVFGNCDDEQALTAEAERLALPPPVAELELTFMGKRIYAYHGTRMHIVEEMARSGLYDYVFHGHTHTPRDVMIGATRVINPGALFRTKQYTFALLDPPSNTLRYVEVPPHPEL
jgi:hypothetical protein